MFLLRCFGLENCNACDDDNDNDDDDGGDSDDDEVNFDHGNNDNDGNNVEAKTFNGTPSLFVFFFFKLNQVAQNSRWPHLGAGRDTRGKRNL